jgi:hypothetical protein
MLQVMDRIASRSRLTPEGCWEWQGSKTPKGYGRIRVGEKLHYVHRIAYEVHVTEIPAGTQLDHLCRNRACVNPSHLEPVTNRVNTIRGDAGRLLGARNSEKSHCPQGHPYDGDNLRIGPHGWRYCRACRREQSRRARAARTI